MGLFNKILHAGEGRKLKSLESIAPVVGALRARDAGAAPTRSCARSPNRWREELDRRGRRRQAAGAPRRPPARGVRGGARGGPAHARPAPLRRPDHGRRRAALRLGRGDEDRRGQDPRRHAARRTSTRSPAAACTSSPSTTTWPSATPSGWGRSTGFLGLEVGVVIPEIDDFEAKRRGVRGRHHLRHQQRVRLRLPARQHGRSRARTRCSAATPSRSSTRSTPSSSTRPARR